MSNIDSSIADEIKKNGWVMTKPVGVSMSPMLRYRKDPIILKKPDKPFKVNDVVAYVRRSDGQQVMHRIIKINNENLVIRGDNCLYNEYTVKSEDIFAILTGFYKGEKYIDCEKSRSYKIYVFFNRATYYPRFVLKKCGVYACSVIRKIRSAASGGTR